MEYEDVRPKDMLIVRELIDGMPRGRAVVIGTPTPDIYREDIPFVRSLWIPAGQLCFKETYDGESRKYRRGTFCSILNPKFWEQGAKEDYAPYNFNPKLSKELLERAKKELAPKNRMRIKMIGLHGKLNLEEVYQTIKKLLKEP